MDSSNKLKVLDLFCGAGGFTKGFTDSGVMDVICGIDFCKPAIESYSKNFDHLALCEDLTKFLPEDFSKKYNINNDGIDIIVGGIPCQSFSLSGRRKMDDPRNTLFMDYIKYLNFFKPKVFIIENVIGILSKKLNDTEKVIDVMMKLLNVDYNCIICKLCAADFEVPQKRRRVIIIGIRKDLNIIPTEPATILKADKWIPVKTILLQRESVSKTAFLSERAIEGIRVKKERMAEKNYGFGAQYLDMDKPSYTIESRYFKDGYSNLVKYAENDIRRLEILELKRLQTFPDDYILCGSKKDVIIQIGNAVPCRFAYHIAKHIHTLITNIRQ